MPTRAMVGAIVAALLVSLALAGCVGPSDETVSSAISHSIVAHVPRVRGAVVDLGSDGTSRDVLIRLYLDDARPATVSAAVEKAVGIAWRASPTDPSEIIISAVDRPEPSGADTSDVGGIDLTATASALGFDEPAIDLTRLSVGERELAKHYGAWKAPR